MPGFTPFFSSKDQDFLLDKLLSLSGSGLVGILDLDSCLFDPRYRQLAICREYAELTDHKCLYAVAADHFYDWNMKATLHRAGISQEWLEQHFKAFYEFWWQRFFSGTHVAFDRLMPGAAIFVRELVRSGMHVVYLTGRHHQQRRETISSLRRHGLPFDVGATLVTKAGLGIRDTEYKVLACETIEHHGKPLLFIDNEPSNCNAFADEYPDAVTVFFQSDHSDRPTRPYAHLPVLKSFWRTNWGLP